MAKRLDATQVLREAVYVGWTSRCFPPSESGGRKVVVAILLLIAFAISMLMLMASLFPARAQIDNTYTPLSGGMCASTLDHHGPDTLVMIGVIVGGSCQWQFTVPDDIGVERMYVVGAGEHDFKSKMHDTYATLWVDGIEFKVARGNSL